MLQPLNEYMTKLMQLKGGWYWSGCWMQNGTEVLWTQKSQQSGLQQWYIQHADAKAKGLGKKVGDCTSVFKYPLWLQPDGSVPYHPETDLNESMIFQKAKDMGLKWGTITTIPRERAGILVTYTGHMGAYLGNGTVLESRGGSYGVVITQLDGRGWQYWYENPFVDYSEGEIMITISNIARKEVYDLQTAYQDLGYPIGAFKNMIDPSIFDGRDGEYGGTCSGITKQIQAKYGLPQTGSVDAITYGKIALELIAKGNSKVISANNEIAVLSESVRAKDGTISSLSNEISALKTATSNEISGLKATNATLVQEKAALQSAKTVVENNLTLEMGKNATLESEISKLSENNNSLSAKNNTLTSEKDRLTEEKDKLVLDNTALQNSLLPFRGIDLERGGGSKGEWCYDRGAIIYNNVFGE